jgi:hypothetical protein
MSFRVNRPVLDLGTRRIFAKEVVAFPIFRRSDWPRNKTTSAVRADVSQNVVDTRRTKRALVGANARFKRFGWQCFVAVFAGGSEFKHVALVMANARVERRATSDESSTTAASGESVPTRG